MAVIHATIEEARLLTANDIDHFVGNGFGSSARRMREIRSSLPKVRGGIVDVDPCKAPRISATDGLYSTARDDDG